MKSEGHGNWIEVIYYAKLLVPHAEKGCPITGFGQLKSNL